MIGKKRIHAGYEDRRYTLYRLWTNRWNLRLRIGEFYSRDLNKAMDDHVVDRTYGWEIWNGALAPIPVWTRVRGKITGTFPFESYDHMHLSLKDLGTSVVLRSLPYVDHLVHKPPHRRRLTEGETLCGMLFDEQDARDLDGSEKQYRMQCAGCYGPDRDKEREREKWLS